MNKRLRLMLVIGILPLLTACGGNGNKLVCSQERLAGVYKQDIIIKFNSDKNEIIGTDLKAVVKISKDKPSQLGCEDKTDEECLEDIIKNMEEICNGSDSFVENCKVSNKSKTGFTFKAHVKDSSLQDYYGEINIKSSMDEIKNSMENALGSNTICK